MTNQGTSRMDLKEAVPSTSTKPNFDLQLSVEAAENERDKLKRQLKLVKKAYYQEKTISLMDFEALTHELNQQALSINWNITTSDNDADASSEDDGNSKKPEAPFQTPKKGGRKRRSSPKYSPESFKKTLKSQESGDETWNKKPTIKPIITKNRFEALSGNEMDAESEEEEEPTQVASTSSNSVKANSGKAPPIFVMPECDWSATLNCIREAAGQDIVGKLSGDLIRLSPAGPDEYRKIISYLEGAEIKYRTFNLKEETPKKCVLRGLPSTTRPDDIKTYLQEQVGSQVKIEKITQLNTTKEGVSTPLPLFLVTFRPKDENAHMNLMKIHTLMGLVVTAEKYHGRKGPIQCYNCQAWGHHSARCRLQAKCLKCGNEHETKNCQKSKAVPCRCANCGRAHPSSFRKCPKFPGQKPNQQDIKNKNQGVRRPLSTSTSSQIGRSRNLPGATTVKQSVNIVNSVQNQSKSNTRQVFVPNPENFPALPNTQAVNVEPTSTASYNAWAKPRPSVANPPKDAGIGGDLQEIFREAMAFMRSFNIQDIIALLKEAALKIKNTEVKMDKLFIFLETGMQLLDIITSNAYN